MGVLLTAKLGTTLADIAGVDEDYVGGQTSHESGPEGVMTARWLCLAAVLMVAGSARAQDALSPRLVAFREIYKELVEINTTDSVGDSTRAAEAMAARLRAAGLPADDVKVLSSG